MIMRGAFSGVTPAAAILVRNTLVSVASGVRAACAFSRSSLASRATVAPLRTSDGTRPKTSAARSRAFVQVVSSGSGCASNSASSSSRSMDPRTGAPRSEIVRSA